jgi:hypothetical protein
VRISRLSRNRDVIYDFLTRARRYHATVNAVHQVDVTELCAALAGRAEVSLLAAFVKASGMVMARYPRLNRHLFHAPWGKYEVDFEEIVCTLVVLRRHAGELILLPANLERPHQRSVEDLHREIQELRRAPLDELPQVAGARRLQRLPRPAQLAFSFLCRSHPRFYRRYFGTYGVSPLLLETEGRVVLEQRGVPTSILANTATAFLPATVSEEPRYVDGQLAPRKILSVLVAHDHYLVDGHDGYLAARHLARLLGDPARLGMAA